MQPLETTISEAAPRRVPEILAPAGGREQFFAALNAGADAVYMGLKGFNARARAENFTADDLRELVPLAHSYGMRILITVNVLIKDVELPELVRFLAELEAAEVDAIIVQDLAVARLARTYFPGLRLHASTQMAVHNRAGVETARDLGFRRVVLARELTALEMRKIRAAVPREEVELEAFCHGSLCYSYSGLCFFSGAEDARSGNRGECAYTCRVPYKITSEPGHGFLFSMRDLDTSGSLDLFVKSGIDTLKIEGRKKDAQYIASTVRLYRESLDKLFGFPTLRREAPVAARTARPDQPDVTADLALSFQRRQTSFFLKGRYHENVIDLDNPTHAGLPVGTVESAGRGSFTVVTSGALERFDGLRLTPAERVYHSLPQDGRAVTSDPGEMLRKYENRNVEFSLRDMTVAGRRVAEAPAGTRVTIDLPEGATAPAPGDVLLKIRSADLKRRVAALAVPPPDAKLRTYQLIDIALTCRPAGDRLLLTACASKLGEPIAVAELAVEAKAATGNADLGADLEAAFAVFGDDGFLAQSVAFSGDRAWFVPRSLIKKLKHELTARLPAAYDEFLAARLARAAAAVAPTKRDATPLPVTARRFAVKTDRLETLTAVAAYAKAHPHFPLYELVFEPKRAFLPELAAEALVDALKKAQVASGVPVRLAIPTVLRAWDEPLVMRWLTTAKEHGFTRLELGNIGAFRLLTGAGFKLEELDLAGDFTLYALSSVATRHWREQGLGKVCLSVEDDLENLRSHLERLAPDERAGMQAILFKDTPLFIAEACSLTALHDGCPTAKVCGYRTLTIANPKGETFHVAHESCKSIVYGDQAYAITHKQRDLLALGVRDFRLDFLTRPYDDAALAAVLDAALLQHPVPATHVANFERRLL
jgi:putative protease